MTIPVTNKLVEHLFHEKVMESKLWNLSGKLISHVKRSAWLRVSTSQNFSRRHFFDVNEVSIVFL